MILLSETLPPLPLPGLIIIIVLIGGIVLAFIGDAQSRKRSVEKINELYRGKILEEISGKAYRGFITNENEFVICSKSGGCIYRVYKLSDIKFVRSFREMSSRQWALEILDENKKRVKGMTYYPFKKNKAPKMTSDCYFVPTAEADAYCALITKYAEHVTRY